MRKAQLIFNLSVTALSERRLGAKLAQDLYTETAASVDAREQRQREIKADRQTLINGRPSEKERRRQRAVKRDFE